MHKILHKIQPSSYLMVRCTLWHRKNKFNNSYIWVKCKCASLEKVIHSEKLNAGLELISTVKYHKVRLLIKTIRSCRIYWPKNDKNWYRNQLLGVYNETTDQYLWFIRNMKCNKTDTGVQLLTSTTSKLSVFLHALIKNKSWRFLR